MWIINLNVKLKQCVYYIKNSIQCTNEYASLYLRTFCPNSYLILQWFFSIIYYMLIAINM